MSKIRAAVIGINGIGKLHGETMEGTGLMDVKAICDINPQMAEAAAEKFPQAKFYTSTAEMYNIEELDLVAVITPHILHAPIAIEALNASVNVIVEKPMATAYSDAQAMIATAKTNKRFLTVFHNRRWDGWFLTAMTIIRDGLLGNLVQIDSGINYRMSMSTWRGFKEQNGGILYDWGAHLIDYCLNFAGSEVKAVSGYFYRAPGSDPRANEDHGTLRIYFVSGLIANITISGLDQDTPLRYKIVGDKGTLLDTWGWDDNGKMKVLTPISDNESAVMEVDYHKTSWKAFYDNVAAHMTKGDTLAVTAESAAKIINILNTAERSYAQGGVPLPLA